MTTDAKPAPKRPYTPPTLVEYGTIASLTKACKGSHLEHNGGSKKKRP